MIKRLSLLLLFACSTAHAQFVTGQILTAQQLNNAFANVLALSGGTLAGPLTVPTMTVTGNLTVNGTFTLNGGLSPSSLAPQAANTVLANVTAASASPTAVALPSCSAANSALKYTSATGFSCGTTYALTTGTLAQFAATTSAQLAGIVSDETGSGSLVFGTSPTIAGATISGGSISTTPISGSTGSFTTLAASGAVSGAGFTNLFASPSAIGSTAANTGAFTGLSASGTVSGTGFSTYLASPPAIGGTTAAAGSFTTLSASGLISPSGPVGIKGTATNDSAQAGSIGEYLTGTTSGTSLTSGTAGNCASVSLTAGDWDVSGVVRFVATSATSIGNYQSGISATSATFGGLGTQTTLQTSWTAGAAIDEVPTPVVRQSLASTTAVFIVALSSFGGTMTCNGFIRARRIR